MCNPYLGSPLWFEWNNGYEDAEDEELREHDAFLSDLYE